MGTDLLVLTEIFLLAVATVTYIAPVPSIAEPRPVTVLADLGSHGSISAKLILGCYGHQVLLEQPLLLLLRRPIAMTQALVPLILRVSWAMESRRVVPLR